MLDCRGVTAISAAADGALTLGTSVCLTVFDGGGKFAPQLDHTDMGSLTVDAVLVAIGQRATDGFPELPRRAGGTIEADAVTLATGLRGVFAAGDAVSGPTSVVLAVAAGKRAATSVQRYLRGLDLAAGRQAPPVAIALPDARHHSLAPPQLSVSQRDNFDEVSLGYDAATAAAQATRCWGCGTTLPAVVFKPRDAHIEVLPWDATRALQLWRERQPVAGETLPPVFEDIEEITAAQGDIVGRHRLVLKAKDSAELLYRTMDDE